ANKEELLDAYAGHYHDRAKAFFAEAKRTSASIQALVRRELPNLRRALDLLFDAGRQRAAAEVADCVTWFLNFFGRASEAANLERPSAGAVPVAYPRPGQRLTPDSWEREIASGQADLQQGNPRAAHSRFTALLTRMEALPEGSAVGPGSVEYART